MRAPIPWTGRDSVARVNITPVKLGSLKDEHDHICFWKVTEWSLPTVDNQKYFEFLAAQIRNYMVHIIRRWKPKLFDPAAVTGKFVIGNNVCIFWLPFNVDAEWFPGNSMVL